jgi:gliding motility-associated-like protein
MHKLAPLLWLVFMHNYALAGNVSITARDIYNSNPDPCLHVEFTYPVTCLPVNGVIQFTNTTVPPAGISITTFSWNFGDPNASAGNPNTSAQANPTHIYKEGTYNVKLEVSLSNGCISDTTIAVTIGIRPQLQFAYIPGACNSALPVSVAFASVTNGITGTGIYSGPGTSTTMAGMFNPGALTGLGPGLSPIKYVFTTTGGCKDSITQTVRVFPDPDPDFRPIPREICLNDSVLFKDSSRVITGNIVLWMWDFMDGTTAQYTNGNPFYHTYSTIPSTWPRLQVLTDSGCGINRSHGTVVFVHPLPVADFANAPFVCLPSPVNFINQSSVPDLLPMTYIWDFGDNSPVSTAIDPSHTYPVPGTYPVSLIVISSFGCRDTIQKIIDKFSDKPIAGFTVSPQEVCQATQTFFNDNSSAPNSILQSWNWDFKDGTFSTATNPVKLFNDGGTFNVSLTVTNREGCVSDPFNTMVTVHARPSIDAGQSFMVQQGTVVQLTATASPATGLSFSWSPAVGISNASILRPLVTVMQDQTYTLTATGDFNCQATDFIKVETLKAVKPPNIFTPNGDNIHDTWNIANLVHYTGCTVEVFNRYGQQVFYSSGYTKAWDGKYKGKDLPVGTYYYIISLKKDSQPLTGSVTIMR